MAQIADGFNHRAGPVRDPRLAELHDWLGRVLGRPHQDLQPLCGDASARRYFRLTQFDGSRVVMDAPPPEDCRSFVTIAETLVGLGLNVPRVLAADLQRGFLLLSDLGRRHYLDELTDTSAAALYQDALAALARLQLEADPAPLPPYDRNWLRMELDLFRQWYLERHLGLVLKGREAAVLEESFHQLCERALVQPRVWVHRDYHSRNLMVTDRNNPGILDFQGAVAGPPSYDLASLLRDCYIRWPRARVEDWVRQHHARLVAGGLEGLADFPAFWQDFEWIGLQRHLKVAGLFVRLQIRDGKAGYLQDLPRVLGYIREVTGRYAQLAPLEALLESYGVGS